MTDSAVGLDESSSCFIDMEANMRLKNMIQNEKFMDLGGLSEIIDGDLKGLILLVKLYPETVNEWLKDQETLLAENMLSDPTKTRKIGLLPEEVQFAAYDDFLSLIPRILTGMDDCLTSDLEDKDLRIRMTARLVKESVETNKENWKDLELNVDQIMKKNNEKIDGPCMLLFLACYAIQSRNELFSDLDLTDEEIAKLRVSFELKAMECLLHFHAINRRYNLDKQIKNKECIINSKQKEVNKKDKVIGKRENKIGELENEVKRLKESLKKKKEKQCQSSSKADKKASDSNAISKDKNRDLLEGPSIEELREVVESLKSELNSKLEEIQSLKRELREVSEEAEREKTLSIQDRLENYLRVHGIDADMVQIVHPYWKDFWEGRKALPNKKEALGKTRIGTCNIVGKEHYVKFPNGERQKVFNLKDDILLAVGQFLSVDKEGRFQECYSAWCPEYLLDESCEWYGKVISLDENQAQVQVFEDDIRKLSTDDVGLHEGWIVGGNNNEITRVFPGLAFHLASAKKSAIARDIEIFWTIAFLKNGAICRNVYNGEQHFCNLEESDYSRISDNSLLFMRNGKVVNIIRDGRHFTHSQLYKHSRTGVIIRDNEKLLLKLPNGELHLVTEIPEGLEVGCRVLTDECFRFIRVLDRESSESGSADVKKRKEIEEGQEGRSLPSLRNESIVIVGNIGLAKSYQREFRKAGYQVTIADGTKEWGHIRNATSGADLILLDTSHMQHHIYYKCKDELLGERVYLNHGSGSQQMIQCVKSVLEI